MAEWECMNKVSDLGDRTRRYWKRLWGPKGCGLGDDAYLVLQRWAEPRFWVTPNTAEATQADDIGPFATLDEATTAAEMLNAQMGVTYETSDN